MPWNLNSYYQFKDIRFKPFYDLAELIVGDNVLDAVDLGCGTGEQTAILSEKFTNINFLGLDSSAEMLSHSYYLQTEHLKFRQSTVEKFVAEPSTWDLIFSNAALQWVDDHRVLFPQLISKLKLGGQLAVQMPYQPENILNKILFELGNEEPFRTYLNDWNRPSPVLDIDTYAKMLFENGLDQLDLSLRVYPLLAADADTLYNFIAGSALIPYFERLEQAKKVEFVDEFKTRINKHFSKFPNIYPFKRILLYGRKNKSINSQ
ncbi:methyltransferase domain-containing protein [Sphingobacterium sp. 2149]|uniref:methyltransferase domain-containing protein n=1 Tax=Sphingobacterium sp. 2149 TaxID=2817763 RepID=UPI001AE72300|nr:methyltransferase domain-containing protein [Sphingobacterium sp. 2149]MDR6737062.1 trans-aconitate 2-methyltransferase [Sphingobacterium sp. 2149]